MSPDDIDRIVLKLHDFICSDLRFCDDDQYFAQLHDWMLDAFEPFYTKDRNYN